MFCKNCGAQLEDNVVYCYQCNTSISPITTISKQQEKKFSVNAIVGLVLSITAIFIFAIPCGVAGVVSSAIALKECGSGKYKGYGLALTGLILSIICIILGIYNIIMLQSA